MTFFKDVLGGIASNLQDSAWWASELPSWLLFTLAAGAIIAWIDRLRYYREREPFERWRLAVLGFDDQEQALDPDEVRRFLNSNFELWKFAKSVASGTHELNQRTVDAALEAGWVRLDRDRRTIMVDLAAIEPAGHGKLRGYAARPKPRTGTEDDG